MGRVLVQTKGSMQAKYLFRGRLYKGRKTDFWPRDRQRGRESPFYIRRLFLHNAYHSRFPAIDLFPSKVYSCCIININTLKRRYYNSLRELRCKCFAVKRQKFSDLTICMIIPFIVFIVILLFRAWGVLMLCRRVKQLFSSSIVMIILTITAVVRILFSF